MPHGTGRHTTLMRLFIKELLKRNPSITNIRGKSRARKGHRVFRKLPALANVSLLFITPRNHLLGPLLLSWGFQN